MLYKRYRLYDGQMEIMVPSELKLTASLAPSQYNWVSADKKRLVNVTKGGSSMGAEELMLRMNEYYKRFSKDVSGFLCGRIKKRQINGQAYGEMHYASSMMGYHFDNIFLIGNCAQRELIVTVQCMEDMPKYMHIFENVMDSLRLL